MERRIYVTLVDGDISRYVYEVGEYSDGVKEHSHYGLIKKMTEEEYAKFKAVVEELYPDTCKFDFDVKF